MRIYILHLYKMFVLNEIIYANLVELVRLMNMKKFIEELDILNY